MKKFTLLITILLFAVLSSYGQWESVNLSEAKAQMGVASLGSKVYFAGGVSQATEIKDLIEIYDVKTGEWSYANLSVGRIVPVGVTCGSKVFFAGGGIAQTMTFFDQVDIYDTLTDQWSVEYLSEPRFGLSAVSKGNKVLFAGGVNLGLNEAYDVVDIYDTETGSWTTDHLSQPRGTMGAAVVGDLAIFAGGYDLQEPSDRVDIYNFTTGQWSTTTLTESRGFVSATTIGNKVLIAGGFSYVFVPSGRVDIYDAVTNNWSTAELTVPRCSENVFSTVCGKSFFVGGGTFTGMNFTECTDVIDVYDSMTNTWSVMNLPLPLVWHSVAAVGDKLLVAGGQTFIPGSGWFDQDLVSIYTNPDCIPQGVIANQERDAFIRVYPNPVIQSTNFSYLLKEPGQVKIEIFDSFGQLVAEPLNAFQTKGEQEMTWDTGKLPAGIYFYRIQAGSEVDGGKIVVVK